MFYGHHGTNIIYENSINNNSLVCKLIYKKFSMLFTGDIEEIAEKDILEKYKNNPNVLNANVLKVAHHGSKTSSNEKFLATVNPKIALIGVGENNKFGHPSDETLKKFAVNKISIYRTDKMGEITLIVNKNSSIKINYLVNNNIK